MNIKDYTLKIGYRIGGKCKEESVEYALVKNGGYDGEDIRICDFGDADHVKIVVSAKSKIEIATTTNRKLVPQRGCRRVMPRQFSTVSGSCAS